MKKLTKRDKRKLDQYAEKGHRVNYKKMDLVKDIDYNNKEIYDALKRYSGRKPTKAMIREVRRSGLLLATRNRPGNDNTPHADDHADISFWRPREDVKK